MKSPARVALLFTLLACLAGTYALAQDVTVSDPVWFMPDPPPGELPKAKNRLRVSYPDDMRKSSEVGYVIIPLLIDPSGKHFSVNPAGTHLLLERAVEASMSDWDFKPALQDGKPINSRVWVAVIFNPKSAALKGADAIPRLLEVAPVITSTRPAPAGQPPVVRMKLSIDANGAILQSAPETTVKPAVLEAINAGLKNWRFAPARQNGQPVAADLVVSVLCQAPPKATPTAQVVPPKVLSQKPPEYPYAMRRYGLRGQVTLDFEVDPKGKVQNPVIASSDNPAFDEPAVKALREWRFQPGTRDGKPETLKLRVSIIFQLNGALDGGESAFQVSQRGDQSKLPPEMRFDTAPKFRGVLIPVYPYELRRDGIRGKAKVTALINQQGRVAAVKIIDADRPEFGAALATALEGFVFDPALKDGRPVQHLLGFEQAFSPTDLPDESGDNLLSLEKKHPDKIFLAGALDTALKPISQRPPGFPKSLLGKVDTGDALIEILVDEEGHVRLPRVVSASDPAFGYAAVQTVVAWWFEPPKAGGKTVTVRAQIPFKFASKSQASASSVPVGEATTKPD